MSDLKKKEYDFPIGGALGRFVTWIVPQREPGLIDEYAHTKPGQDFTALLKTIFKDKRIRRLLPVGYFCEIVFAAIYVLMPLVIGRFVGLFLEGNGQVSYHDLAQLALIASAMMFCAGFVNFFGVRFADQVAGIAEAQTRRQMTWWALGHSAGWFATREAGQIAHRIAEVSRQINTIGSMFAYHIIPVMSSLCVVSVVLYHSYVPAALFFIFWTIIFLTMSLRLGIISQKFMMRTVRRRAEASGLVTDAVINHALIRLFNAKHAEDHKIDRASQKCFEAFMESSSWARVKNSIRDVWLIVLVAGMIYILGHGFIEGRLGASTFVSAMGMLFVLIAQVRSLHHIIKDTMEAIGTVREGLIHISVEHDIHAPSKSDFPGLENQKIELKEVGFFYQDTKTVLRDVNLEIPEGQKIGLVGPSGAGKSTLIALLLRLWDTQDGEIRVGSQNIKDIPFEVLHGHSSLIPQDTALFHRSLYENIAYGRPGADEAEVIEAAKRAHAHEFISDLPEGYETLVGERGVKLSGGQRQRIAIARAILKDAPILILDEATSALDSESEKLIQESLKELMEGKTVIAIAHRLSTIAHLDRLIVMDQGRIVEDGTHEELLNNNGLYAKLWGMQSGGFLGE